MIEIKTAREAEKIRKASGIVAETLMLVAENSKPGTSTLELDRLARGYIRKKGGEPAFLGYRGYPATICASLNEEIVHGIPSEKKILRKGDILSVDVGCVFDGFYGDAALTVAVGGVSPEKKRLVEVTRKSLENALSAVREGATVGDIGFAVEKTAAAGGVSVVRNYTGHGVGRALHEEPSIPNYGLPGTGAVLKDGMTLAIEPMLCLGSSDNEVKEDGWTVVTKDGKPSAHFEHTVLVKKDGCEILSLPL